jgi:alpha-glucosidase
LAVSKQEVDGDSALAFTRQFLAARKASKALRWGEIGFRDAASPLLVFERGGDGERVLCVFNMSAKSVTFAPDAGARPLDVGGGNTQAAGAKLALGPYGFWLARL